MSGGATWVCATGGGVRNDGMDRRATAGVGGGDGGGGDVLLAGEEREGWVGLGRVGSENGKWLEWPPGLLRCVRAWHEHKQKPCVSPFPQQTRHASSSVCVVCGGHMWLSLSLQCAMCNVQYSTV
jgi:hypothetical protein